MLCCKADGKGDFIVPYHKERGKIDCCCPVQMDCFRCWVKKICENIDLSIAKRIISFRRKEKNIIEHIIDDKKKEKALEQLLKGVSDK